MQPPAAVRISRRGQGLVLRRVQSKPLARMMQVRLARLASWLELPLARLAVGWWRACMHILERPYVCSCRATVRQCNRHGHSIGYARDPHYQADQTAALAQAGDSGPAPCQLEPTPPPRLPPPLPLACEQAVAEVLEDSERRGTISAAQHHALMGELSSRLQPLLLHPA